MDRAFFRTYCVHRSAFPAYIIGEMSEGGADLKKILLSVTALALLLSGCGAKGYDRTAQLQELYGALQGYTAEIKVDIPRETETLHFALSLEKDGEKIEAQVLAPDALKGITARMDDESLSLVYDGVMLDAGTLCPRVSALTCVPLLLSAFPESYVSVQSEESLGEQNALRVCFETEVEGEPLACTVYFSEENAPLYAEIAADGKIIVFAEFTNFAFGDILSSDAQAESD